MEREAATEGEARESGDVVNNAMREIGRGADEEDSVTVDKARNCFDGDAVSRGRAGDLVELNVEIIGCFVKSCVCCVRYDSETNISQRAGRVLEQL